MIVSVGLSRSENLFQSLKANIKVEVEKNLEDQIKQKYNGEPDPYEELSRTAYFKIGPGKILDELETVIIDETLIKTVVLESKFPELEADSCVSLNDDNQEVVKPCETKMYIATSHNNGESYIDQLPTVLIMGGLSGEGVMDKSVIINFMSSIQKLYSKKREWFFLLNNMRLLIIPFLNSPYIHQQNVLKKTKKEKLKNEPFYKDFDFETDFDIKGSGNCYQTFQTQVLNQIYHKYLILGTLYLDNSPAGFLIPKIEEVIGSYIPKFDDDFYKRVVIELSQTFNTYRGWGGKFMDLKQSPLNEQNVRKMNFIEWTYSGSSMKDLASDVCMNKKNKYKTLYKAPNEYSNRSFSIQISLGIPETQDIAHNLGNEITLADKLHPYARKGIITAAVLTIRNFLEILRPFVTFQKAETLEKKPVGNIMPHNGYKVKGVIHGCLERPHFKNNLDQNEIKVISKDLEIKEKGITRIYSFSEEIKFENAKLNSLEKLDILYDFECLDQWETNTKPISSHFLKMRFKKDYKKAYKTFNLRPITLHNYYLKNLVFKYSFQPIISQKYVNEAICFVEKELFVQIGNIFPIKFEYNIEKRKVKMIVLEKEIHNYLQENNEQYKESKEAFSVHFGLMNHLNKSCRSKEYLNNLETLANPNKNFYFSIYNSEQALMSHEIEKDLNFMDHLYDKKPLIPIKGELLLDNFKQSVSFSSSEYNEQSEEFAKLKDNPLVKGLANYIINSFTNRLRKSLSKSFLLRTAKNKGFYLLPSMFIELLGKPVTLWLDPEKILTSDEFKNKNQETFDLKFYTVYTKKNRKRLNGIIVKKDKNIIDLNELPSPSKNKRGVLKNPIVIPLGGIHCTNLNPLLGVNQYDYENNFQYYTKTQLKKMAGFSMNILPSNFNRDQTKITILTTFDEDVNHLILQVKNSYYKIYLSQKKLNLQGIDKQVEENLKIFKSNFLTQEIPITGSYMQIINPNNNQLIFDCFPYNNSNNFDQNESIKMFYRMKQRLLKLSSHYEKMTKEQSLYYKVISFFNNYLLVPLLCLSIILLALYIYMKEKKTTNQFENDQKDPEIKMTD